MALANLVQDIELRNALINLNVLPRLMAIGLKGEQKLMTDEFNFVLAFGEILASLILENPILQQQLISNFDIMNFSFKILLAIKEKQSTAPSESYKIQEVYSKILRRLLDYEENLQSFCSFDFQGAYQNILDFSIKYYNSENTDEQSGVNSYLVQCLYIIANNPSYYQLFTDSSGLSIVCSLCK